LLALENPPPAAAAQVLERLPELFLVLEGQLGDVQRLGVVHLAPPVVPVHPRLVLLIGRIVRHDAGHGLERAVRHGNCLTLLIFIHTKAPCPLMIPLISQRRFSEQALSTLGASSSVISAWSHQARFDLSVFSLSILSSSRTSSPRQVNRSFLGHLKNRSCLRSSRACAGVQASASAVQITRIASNVPYISLVIWDETTFTTLVE